MALERPGTDLEQGVLATAEDLRGQAMDLRRGRRKEARELAQFLEEESKALERLAREHTQRQPAFDVTGSEPVGGGVGTCVEPFDRQ